jgi:hypothetical protein
MRLIGIFIVISISGFYVDSFDPEKLSSKLNLFFLWTLYKAFAMLLSKYKVTTFSKHSKINNNENYNHASLKNGIY